MPIDILKMFEDIIPNTATQDRETGEAIAQRMTQMGGLGSGFARHMPAIQRGMRGSVGNMLGIETRNKGEILEQTLQSSDFSTPEARAASLARIGQLDQTAALKIKTMLAEQDRQEQLSRNQTTQALASQTSAQAAASNAATNAANQLLEPQRIALAEREMGVAEGSLALNNTTQEDLRAWRVTQDENTDRENDLREQEDETRRLLAQTAADDLDSRASASIREATAEGRAFRNKTADARRIANEFKALQPIAGSAALVAEKWKGLTGTQDEVSLLRANFNSIKNALVMSSLPPGMASDKDIELALSGFPTDTWSPEQIYSFMQGMAKISALTAEESLQRALHLRANRGTDEGFDDEWRSTMAGEGFSAMMEEKYGLRFDEESQSALQSAGAMSGMGSEDIAAEIARQQAVNNALNTRGI